MLQGQLWHGDGGRILSGSSLGFTARSLGCCPWWPVQEEGVRAGARPADGRAAHGRLCPAAPAPRRRLLRAPRAKRMNQPRPPFPVLSLKSAGGRAQRRSMLAFREHSPSRPSRPRGAVWLPRDSLRKGSELPYANRTALPATSPRYRPEAAGTAALKRSREARPRARVCAALLWSCLAPEQQKTRRGAPATRRLGSPWGSGGAQSAPSAQALRSRTCPAGTLGRTVESWALCPIAACQAQASWVQGDLGQALLFLQV